MISPNVPPVFLSLLLLSPVFSMIVANPHRGAVRQSEPIMAPARTAKNRSAADAIISSPASLLWAHQLRREHSVLLTRIEDLVAIVNNISPAQISTLHSRVQFTES